MKCTQRARASSPRQVTRNQQCLGLNFPFRLEAVARVGQRLRALMLHSCLWQTTSHQRVEVAASVRSYWPATSRVQRRRIIMMAAASKSIPIQRQSAAL